MDTSRGLVTSILGLQKQIVKLDEYTGYKEIAAAPPMSSPFIWLSQNHAKFPNIFKLAMEVLTSNCSSAAVESRLNK